MICLPSEKLTDLGCIPTDPISFVEKFYGIGLSIIGAIALLFIIFGGYTILISQGNPSELNKGKSYILYSILGLLLAILGFAFFQLIVVNVLHIPGFQ